MKQYKHKRINAALGDLDTLLSYDLKVEVFSDIHYRISGVLDIWPTTKHCYDRSARKKGVYTGSLVGFAREHFGV
jgi:hypothetical protein